MATIRIACEGAGLLSIDDMTEFQGELKSLSKANYEKLKMQLEKGYSFPIAIWKAPDGLNYILDGHQRLRTLSRMRSEGWVVPLLPVSYTEAQSYKEAKEKLLAAASQFGTVESQGLYEFLSDANLDIDEIVKATAFPEINFDDFRNEFFDNNHDDEPTEKKPKKKLCPECGHSF